jgi:hypothetical protein
VLDSSLDLDALVANMAELAALAPSWRDHVPHDVAAIRAIEVLAQLGDHAAALRQIGKIVEVRGLAWRGADAAASESG